MTTFLYKFRSGINYEPLTLPGSTIHLFDVKRAIVRAKKLDRNSPTGRSAEFDLTVQNATTGEEYTDESSILRRGTRLVVRRVPSARGQGILSRIGRAESGLPLRRHFRERRSPDVVKEPTEQERHEASRESQGWPKKRPVGIPRSLLNKTSQRSTANPVNCVDTSIRRGEWLGAAALHPNVVGFESIARNSGDRSECGPEGKNLRLDYALKTTATSVPDHLRCAMCSGVVKNAMIIPWDSEGRTACETCIRNGLVQNEFRCPITGRDGVSPEDLVPNHGLRKEADRFIKDVMEKMDEIEINIVAQQKKREGQMEGEASATSKSVFLALEGDDDDKVVAVPRREEQSTSRQHRQGKDPFGDPFGGDDVFGGDVFDVDGNKGDQYGMLEDEGIDKQTDDVFGGCVFDVVGNKGG